MNFQNFTFLFAFLFTINLSAQLTLKVVQIPINSPADFDIYVAGNFQGWNPGDPSYQFTDNGDGTFEIIINPNPGTLEFKFTRGSWATVEGNANGGFLPNRTLNYDGSPTEEMFEILSWEDVGGTNSTAADNVQIFDTDFFIPQLNRTRRIWVYLPPDYQTTDKHYPVLYMHDGQNCFDDATSFAGEWKVDESLNELHAEGDFGIIVVAIDNGSQHRTDEYSPFVHPQHGGGEGHLYLEFIVNDLKPVIDATFRTRSERDFTGIMGSSLGGLISHFAMLKHNETFGKVGIFSPSYWFTKTETFNFVTENPKESATKAYTIMGQPEGAQHVANVNEMHNHLLNNGFETNELYKEIHSDGAHSEWYWAREFPAAYEWLFGDLDFTSTTEIPKSEIEIFPNPSFDTLNIKNWESLENPVLEIVKIDGKLIYPKADLTNGKIELEGLEKGIYVVKIWSKNKIVAVKKWIKQR